MQPPFDGFPHVIASQQFNKPFLRELFGAAQAMQQHPEPFRRILDQHLVIIAYGEVSTRTFTSFDVAAKRLGAIVSGSQSMNVTSSMVKGESFDDTVRTLLEYSPSYMIMRWPHEGSLARAAELAGNRCCVINAGDGPGQHPTQALLDLHTIWLEHQTLDTPYTVAVVGDLKRGRTAHSLVYLLAKFAPTRFFFVSPPSGQMKPEILEYLDRHDIGYDVITVPRLEDIAPDVDVWYMTRPQLNLEADPVERDRMLTESQPFGLTTQIMAKAKSTAIILHPLPRTAELPTELDSDPRARYFSQAGNGLWLRMALLERLHYYRSNLTP